MNKKDPTCHTGKRKSALKRILAGLAIAVILLAFTGTFIGELRWVPTPSMENTIMARTMVWMDKTRYGARMPRRFWDIPVVKYGFFLIPQLYRPDQKLDWGYHRMKGSGAPERGDIIAFDHPLGDNTLLCKRLIGLPGDTVELRNGKAFVNGKELCMPRTVIPTMEIDTVYATAFLKGMDWNTHNYGPLTVPIDDCNPYYFVLGDNRRNSQDSRVWGFVRFTDIVGKVLIPQKDSCVTQTKIK